RPPPAGDYPPIRDLMADQPRTVMVKADEARRLATGLIALPSTAAVEVDGDPPPARTPPADSFYTALPPHARPPPRGSSAPPPGPWRRSPAPWWAADEQISGAAALQPRAAAGRAEAAAD